MSNGRLSIRFINYTGDYDDLDEINIIGPYPDRNTRNADLYRLERLPGGYGYATFEDSDSDGSGADYHVTPNVIAQATTFCEFLEAFFNLSPFGGDEPVGEVHPDQTSIYAALAEHTGGRQ